MCKFLTMASSSSVAAIHPEEKYDVFISFRGKDTRRTFTSHLHAALIRRKVETYIDYRLERGDEVRPALLRAIEESKISVIILSEDYASSTWCLDELAYILECKDRTGQHVIPIFYEIDPSQVRYQTGNYATAFLKHKTRLEESMDRVLTWKNALTKVADLSGFDSSSFTVRDESNLVEQVVEDILAKLNYEPASCDLRGFVGLERRIQQVLLELDIIPEDVRVRSLVIWGMGGIGKTTLADVVFHGLSSQFEACCFLADVRERSKTKGIVSPDLYKLRDKMVRKLLGEETLTMETPTVPTFVRVRLQRTKVLLVLDDVDDLIQLEFLAGDKIPFGTGSRILITTRDLKQATEMKMVRKGANHDVKIYNFEKLNVDESCQLFYSDALRDLYSSAMLEVILSEVVDSAAGIPLALRIWHSLFIHCKSIREIENLWTKIRRYPVKKLQNGYWASYEVLEENEREIFLDIACFHKGENLSDAKRLLDACGLFPNSGIQRLIDMSLISIKEECVWMHDVIQEMGWAIVNEECPEEPGNRSRLYTYKDVRHVLENNTGTTKVQGISTLLAESDNCEIKLSPQAFNNMHRLRYLQLHGYECDSDLYLESLPNALGYVSLVHFPFKNLPSSFSPDKLVELHLAHSKLQRLWSEEQNPRSLKRISLSFSSELVDVSGLSKCINIESINLEGCESLLQIPSDFQNLTSLTDLNLAWCSKIISIPEMPCKMEILNLVCTGIERLPSSIFESMNIKRLDLYGCSRLKKFPEIMEPMECLEYLDLRVTGIQELPCSFANLVGIKELKLGQCSNLEIVYNLKHLEDLSFNLQQYPSRSQLKRLPPSPVIFCPLISLDLYGCSLLEEIPDALVTLTSLQSLNLSGTRIPIMPPMKQNSGLSMLCLNKCMDLQSLPELPCLVKLLLVNGCTSLKTVSFSMTTLEHGQDSHWYGMHSFGGCLNLDENARNNIMNNAHHAILRLATANNLDRCGIDVLCPGNKIPKWFSCESKGSSINIKLPLHWADDFLGFAFCIVSDRTTTGRACDFKLNFKNKDGESHHVVFSIPYHQYYNSDHMLVWYRAEKISDASKLSFEAFIEFGSETVVQRCGVCFLYDQGREDALKFEVIDSEQVTAPLGPHIDNEVCGSEIFAEYESSRSGGENYCLGKTNDVKEVNQSNRDLKLKKVNDTWASTEKPKDKMQADKIASDMDAGMKLTTDLKKKPKKTPYIASGDSLKQETYQVPLVIRWALRTARKMDSGAHITIPIPPEVFGNDHSTFLGIEDIVDFCTMGSITTVCISVYMRYLWSLLRERNQDHLYGFADPGRYSENSGNVEHRVSALFLKLDTAKENQIIIAPYNSGYHWMLAAIDPYNGLVYYFDSLSGTDINPGLKGIVEICIRIFNVNKSRYNQRDPIWEVMECPAQVGSVECGYYVMKYMKELIEEPAIPITTKFSKRTYTQAEIDEVRVEWVEVIDAFFQDEE